jgi:hypothetical protein
LLKKECILGGLEDGTGLRRDHLEMDIEEVPVIMYGKYTK